MNPLFKKLIFTTLAIGVVVIASNIYINNFLKSKLESFIQERLPENMVRTYDNITLEAFTGTLSILNASLIINNKEDDVEHTFIQVERLKIADISYWEYLFNNQIHIGSILVENPTLAYHQDKRKPSKDTVRKPVAEIHKPIRVDFVKISNTKLAIYEDEKDSTKVYTKNLNIVVEGIEIDNKTVLQKIPLKYKHVKAKSDTAFVKVGPYENLIVDQFLIEDHKATFEDVQLKTKYSKKELSNIIRVERDHYDLSIPILSVNNFNLRFRDDERFFATSHKITINRPIFDVYRDKLIEDDETFKPLYARSLRNLPFDLTVDSIEIKDANIKYTERTQAENQGGSVSFKDLNAHIMHVSNTGNTPEKTEIAVEALFMDQAPLQATWTFDVQNKNDSFLFEGELDNLDVKRMNAFTEPNLRIALEGAIHKTYFTIDGNNDNSTTNMRMNFSDFKVDFLKKESEKTRKLLSEATNLFINHNGKNKEGSFKNGTGKTDRNKTQSAFNQLWISIQSALLKIII